MILGYGRLISNPWKYLILFLLTVDAISNQCPTKCICDESTIKCVKNQLRYVPDFKKVNFNPDTVDLSENSIVEITNLHFVYKKLEALKYLQLNDNDIFNVETSAFVYLTGLEYLDLSNNQLDAVPSEIIEKNTKLLELNLSDNLFGSNTPTIKSTSLLVLDLSSCKLTTFTEDNLKGTPNLEALYLHINNFQHLDYHTFRKSNLKFLDITYNPWKCHCDTIKLFEHLIKFGMVGLKNSVQCVHGNRFFEEIYSPKGPLSNKFCTKKTYLNNQKSNPENSISPEDEQPKTKNVQEIDRLDYGSPGNTKENVVDFIMRFEVLIITGIISVLIVVSLITLAVVVRRTNPTQRPAVYGQLPTKATFL